MKKGENTLPFFHIFVSLKLRVEADGAELGLVFAEDIACVVQVGLDLLRVGVEIIAQRFQRLIILVP